MVRIDPNSRTWDPDHFTLDFAAQTDRGLLTIKITPDFVHDRLGCRGSQEEMEQACLDDLDLVETTADERQRSWVESNGRFTCTL